MSTIEWLLLSRSLVGVKPYTKANDEYSIQFFGDWFHRN
jgi:hypothetical protein